jgi:hypothetical protein
MSLQGHIVELQRRHEALEKEIQEEQNHPSTDEARLAKLKRKKLLLKDEMTKLEQQTYH